MRNRGKTLFFAALPVSLALMLSCSGLLDLEVPKGALVLELTSSVASRTIEPAVDLNVEKYDISGTGPGGASFSASDIVGPSYVKSQLIAGEWTIVATGKNSDGKAIVRGQADKVKVEARNTVTKSIACTPIAGNGTLSLSLSWPAGSIDVPSIVATLTPKGGLVQSLSMPISGMSASYANNSLSNGFYTLNIKLRDNYDTGKLCWSLVSTVLILAGETTSGSWSLQEGDLALFPFGGVTLALSSDPRKPIPLALTGLPSDLASGQTMTVAAGGAPAGSTFRWYLNGDLIPGLTTASVSLGSGLSVDTYWLSCIAEVGEIAGSVVSSFRIYQPAIEGMVFVEGGTFTIGKNGDVNNPEASPEHQATISSFYIAQFEVTQQLYTDVIGVNPSFQNGSAWLRGSDHPVEQVSWNDAISFCNAYSLYAGLEKVYTISGSSVTADLSKNGYRLPTEAEWEFAAKGGKYGHGYIFSGSDNIDSIAWYSGNSSGGNPRPVGTKAPNELGIYDMTGNVQERVWDFYGSYLADNQTNPQGPTSGTDHVIKGGWAGTSSNGAVIYYRGHWDSAHYSMGLRVARTKK